jgi:initiation factor 1A
MVKNLKGGTGHKKLARKHENQSSKNKLRLPEEDGEVFGCVTNMFGNGMCEVYTNDNTRLIGHIRGSFRGRQKRHNTISKNTIVLIGLRSWESVLKNCDILYIYSDSDIKQVIDIPNINIKHILTLHMGPSYISNEITNNISFEDTLDNDEEITSKIYATASANKNTNEFKLTNIDDVDMDDI